MPKHDAPEPAPRYAATSAAATTVAQRQVPPARLALRLVAAFLLVFGLVYWSGKGAHTGWSMNRVPSAQVDEITGIEYIEYEERFVPGIEWLGGALGLAALSYGLSLFFRPNKKIKTYEKIATS